MMRSPDSVRKAKQSNRGSNIDPSKLSWAIMQRIDVADQIVVRASKFCKVRIAAVGEGPI